MRGILLLVLFWGCDEERDAHVSRDSRARTPCEQALVQLTEWSNAEPLSSQRQAALVVPCEDGRAMATADRLDCLLEETPEAAAQCTVQQDREEMIAACVEDGGEEFREDCETQLVEPSPVLLEARIRPLRNGLWLALWTCHSPSEEELAPSPEQLLGCGMKISREMLMDDCLATQFDTAACNARWEIHSPRAEAWLRQQLQPASG